MVEAVHLAGIIAVLALYNNLAHFFWRGLHGRFYVQLNLLFLALLLIWAWLGLGLSVSELGLSAGDAGESLLWGVAVGWGIGGPVLATLLLPRRLRAALQDPRTKGLSGRGAAYRALIRIPLGTALFEEMAFRGVLFGALLSHGTVHAVWVSAVVFGLWHVGPILTKTRLRGNSGGLFVVAVEGVLLTTAMGTLLAVFRHYTDSVAGPMVAHGLVNSLALLTGFWNGRTAAVERRRAGGR